MFALCVFSLKCVKSFYGFGESPKKLELKNANNLQAQTDKFFSPCIVFLQILSYVCIKLGENQTFCVVVTNINIYFC